MVNVWRLMAHHCEDCHLTMIQWSIANNRIAMGWGVVGSLAQPEYSTPQAIRAAAIQIADHVTDEGAREFLQRPLLGINLGNFRGGAHPFYPRAQGNPHPNLKAMQCGDLVILKTNLGPRYGWANSVVMRVTGPYVYVDPPQPLPCISNYGYQHQRNAEHTGCDPRALWDTAGGVDGVYALGQAIVGNALVLLGFQVECEGGQIRRAAANY